VGRYILRFRGKGPKPAEDVERVRAASQTVVLDDSSPRMLLVDGPDDEVRKLVDEMPEWVASPERFFELPDPRVRVKQLDEENAAES
jgi:hypothetical protein